MGETFLDRAYRLETTEETQALYRDWAGSYDSEVGENGYATPARAAKALRRHLKERDVPILDFGCGTGLSGLALRAAGFSVLDGMDPSDAMLAEARAKEVYRHLTRIDPEDDRPVPADRYRAITAVGAIGTGAAPAATIDLLLRALPVGGLLTFSLNDHALADPAYPGRLNQWLDCGAARLRFSEHGPHLPRQNIDATVYVLEKA